jgi:type II secretion system protein C
MLYPVFSSPVVVFASEVSNKNIDAKSSGRKPAFNSGKRDAEKLAETFGIKLVGTICTSDEKTSLAIIESKKHQSIYHKGSQLPNGAKIKSIFPDHILVEKSGKKKMLKITSGSGFDSKELGSKGYQKVAANEWIVNPKKLFKSVGDIARLCGDLDMGKTKEGLRIEDISDNELLKELGVRKGDILRKVNGKEFDSLYDALEYIWNLKESEPLNIKILRDANEQTLVFHPNYDQLPDYVKSGSVTPRKITGMLTAKHEYKITNIMYKNKKPSSR